MEATTHNWTVSYDHINRTATYTLANGISVVVMYGVNAVRTLINGEVKNSLKGRMTVGELEQYLLRLEQNERRGAMITVNAD